MRCGLWYSCLGGTDITCDQVGEVYNPHALPMYREERNSKKRKERSDRKDPVKSKKPDPPVRRSLFTVYPSSPAVFVKTFVIDCVDSGVASSLESRA